MDLLARQRVSTTAACRLNGSLSTPTNLFPRLRDGFAKLGRVGGETPEVGGWVGGRGGVKSPSVNLESNGSCPHPQPVPCPFSPLSRQTHLGVKSGGLSPVGELLVGEAKVEGCRHKSRSQTPRLLQGTRVSGQNQGGGIGATRKMRRRASLRSSSCSRRSSRSRSRSSGGGSSSGGSGKSSSSSSNSSSSASHRVVPRLEVRHSLQRIYCNGSVALAVPRLEVRHCVEGAPRRPQALPERVVEVGAT